MILVVALIWGILLSLATSGTLRGLTETKLPSELAIIALFVLQGISRSAANSSGSLSTLCLAAWAASGIALSMLLLRIPHEPTLTLVVLGLALNLFVVMLNSGMPVGEVHAGLPSTSAVGAFYHAATTADAAVVLADVVPLPGGWLLSLGDLLLVVGSTAFIAQKATVRNTEHTSDLARATTSI